MSERFATRVQRQLPRATLGLILSALSLDWGLATQIYPHPLWVVGRVPVGLAIGDLNQDAIPDAIVAVAGENSIRVLLGRPGRRFDVLDPVRVGETPVSVAVARLNRDTALDLVVANERSNDISVLLGTGDGRFLPGGRFAAGDAPGSVRVQDLDQDGLSDVVVSNLLSGDVSILLGRGDGSFGEQRRYPAGSYPFAVAVADLNNDGLHDLIVTGVDWSGTVSVLLGRGSGSFADPVAFGAGPTPVSVDVGDLNKDGVQDIVVANYIESRVRVFPGNGDGTFRLPVVSKAGVLPFSVAIADIDGGVGLDLVVANFGSDDLTVLKGLGDGSFVLDASYGVGGGPVHVVVQDLNGDTRPELVSVQVRSGDLSVLWAGADGGYPTERRFQVGRFPRSLAAGDLNADGHLDLLVPNWGLLGLGPFRSDASILLGDGAGAFGSDRRIEVGAFPLAVGLGDLNGDQRLDAVVAVQGGSHCSICPASISGVSVLTGQGDGTFSPERRFGMESPLAMSLADLNADGVLDLAVAEFRDINVSMLGQVSVFAGLGNGNFRSGTTSLVGVVPRNIASADLNRDGIMDLVVANEAFFWTVEDLEATPPVLEARAANSTPAGLRSHNPADKSFAMLSGYSQEIPEGEGGGEGEEGGACLPMAGSVSVLLGVGGGVFDQELRLDAGCRTSSVLAADFNNDGREDLAAPNAGSSDVSVWLGRGDGGFQGERRYTVGLFPLSAVAGDFNSDRKTDLAVANASGESVSILFGKGDGTFMAERRFWAGFGPVDMVAGDFNGDGFPDLVTANFASNDVSVLLHQGMKQVEIRVVAPVGRNSKGVLRVAVLSDSEFHAPTLVLSSLQVNGQGVLKPGASGRALCHSRDVNADHLTDLVCHFSAAGLTGGGLQSTLVLEGSTSDGTLVRGETTVRLVP